MKKYIYIKALGILICSALFASPFLYGQDGPLFWGTSGNTGATVPATNKLGTLGVNTNLNIYGGGTQRMVVLGTNGFVGVGNNFTSPGSLLHVNACGNSTGCLFRTDGDNTKINMWQLFTGSSVATTTEIFRLSVPGNTSNVLFNALHAGNIQFQTGSITRIFIQNDTAQEGFQVAGNVGVGTKFVDPLRKLDVFDNSGAPQFRITYNLARNKRTVSEFQTTRNGDMIFTNHDSLGNLGKFGFQITTPGNTVEINSSLASPTTSNSVTAAPDFTGNATGRSGLRFTDLNSNSIPQVNPGKGMLAVDANGDVIYVPNVKTGVTKAQYDSAITALKNNITSLQTSTAAMQNQINQLTTLINSCCNANSNNCGNNNKYDHWGNNCNNHNNNSKNGNINCRSSNLNTLNSVTIDLKDLQTVVLAQNIPNPFAEQTIIDYFLPDDVEKAQMLFYNVQGKLINTVDLMQKGEGSVIVFAQDLASGIYTYTIIADGEVLKSKKMIKQ